jgi:hypothetical protein
MLYVDIKTYTMSPSLSNNGVGQAQPWSSGPCKPGAGATRRNGDRCGARALALLSCAVAALLTLQVSASVLLVPAAPRLSSPHRPAPQPLKQGLDGGYNWPSFGCTSNKHYGQMANLALLSPLGSGPYDRSPLALLHLANYDDLCRPYQTSRKAPSTPPCNGEAHHASKIQHLPPCAPVKPAPLHSLTRALAFLTPTRLGCRDTRDSGWSTYNDSQTKPQHSRGPNTYIHSAPALPHEPPDKPKVAETCGEYSSPPHFAPSGSFRTAGTMASLPRLPFHRSEMSHDQKPKLTHETLNVMMYSSRALPAKAGDTPVAAFTDPEGATFSAAQALALPPGPQAGNGILRAQPSPAPCPCTMSPWTRPATSGRTTSPSRSRSRRPA